MYLYCICSFINKKANYALNYMLITLVCTMQANCMMPYATALSCNSGGSIISINLCK